MRVFQKFQRASLRTLGLTGILLLVVAAALIPDSSETEAPRNNFAPIAYQRFDLPGVRVQQVYQAHEFRLADTDVVVGVVIDGTARAYLTDGMAVPNSHIAYDKIGEVDIAIAYCDLTGNARVFCGDRQTIESVRLGGMSSSNMTLLIDQDYYTLDAADIPLKNVPFESTTWAKWKAKHPNTKIYLGDSAPGFSDDLEAENHRIPAKLRTTG